MVTPLTKLPWVPVELRQRHHVYIPHDTPYRAAARLAQALWREDHNFPIGHYFGRDGKPHPLGSRLDYAAVKIGANYLTQGIAKIARHRIAADNLLSSRPLTFNLLAPWALDLIQASCYLTELLPINTAHVQQVRFEHKPWVGAPATWDAFISYTDADDRTGFVAIETKFSENLNPIPQLEREYGLAISLLDVGRYAEGYLILIAPELNAPIHYASQVFQEAKGVGKLVSEVSPSRKLLRSFIYVTPTTRQPSTNVTASSGGSRQNWPKSLIGLIL